MTKPTVIIENCMTQAFGDITSCFNLLWAKLADAGYAAARHEVFIPDYGCPVEGTKWFSVCVLLGAFTLSVEGASTFLDGVFDKSSTLRCGPMVKDQLILLVSCHRVRAGSRRRVEEKVILDYN